MVALVKGCWNGDTLNGGTDGGTLNGGTTGGTFERLHEGWHFSL